MTINGLITCGGKKEEGKPQNTYKNCSKDGMRVHFLKIAPKKAVKERRNEHFKFIFLKISILNQHYRRNSLLV